MAVTQDERQALGLEGRDVGDNVVCQLDTQPLPRNAGAGGQTDSPPNCQTRWTEQEWSRDAGPRHVLDSAERRQTP